MNSVKDIVDCISICDTESTDNTIEIIEQFLFEHQIPGKAYRHEWKNFEHNRNLSTKAAQQTLEELSFSLSDMYLLLLDADMILTILPEFKKNQLYWDSYLLLQSSYELSYYNTRLIKTSLPWKCVGLHMSIGPLKNFQHQKARQAR